MTRRVAIVVQARMTSTRLPGKMMMDIGGKVAIGHVLDRVKRTARADGIWLACANTAADDPLATFGGNEGVEVFRGDEQDVLSRFVAVADAADADIVVRITGDCPMTDPVVIDRAIERHLVGDVDFVSNTLQRSYPDGLDVEVFSRNALMRANEEATDPFLRSHVSPYIHGRLIGRVPTGDFTRAQIVSDVDFSHLRWTLDEVDDLDFFRRLLPRLPDGYGWMDAVAELTRDPALLRINSAHELHEGTERDLAGTHRPKPRFDRSNEFFERAARSIPLATQTFSKSYQQWAKGSTPLFIDRGYGCHVWDLDGNRYVDHVLALLPVVLGYCDPDVNAAITRQLEKGICFSLASPLESELAEILTQLIPCAEMVRFGKNGSDATTGAIRLARAHTKRDRIVACGYHGWHDWYIGTTTRDAGVPGAVKRLTTSVSFNDLDAVEEEFRRHGDNIAAVIVEPTSKDSASTVYLEGLRAITRRYGALLIFDEIITGFRVSLGGAQAVFGVTPDLACFGKAMANGMPIAAVVGQRDIMKGMEDIFFSTTFGGETLSLAAAIATIRKLESENVPERLARRGRLLMDRMNVVLAENRLAKVAGFGGEPWWPRLTLTPDGIEPAILNTLFRQEFVAQGLLIGASLNLCLAHDDDAVTDDTVARAALAAAAVAEAVISGDPASFLKGDRVQPTFAVR